MGLRIWVWIDIKLIHNRGFESLRILFWLIIKNSQVVLCYGNKLRNYLSWCWFWVVNKLAHVIRLFYSVHIWIASFQKPLWLFNSKSVNEKLFPFLHSFWLMHHIEKKAESVTAFDKRNVSQFDKNIVWKKIDWFVILCSFILTMTFTKEYQITC